MVSCEARCLPKQLKGKRGIGGCKEKGPKGPFSFAYRKLAGPKLYKASRAFMERKLPIEQERERLARWIGKGEIYDPRNEEDFDTFLYGTEPLPGDTTWAKKKAP